MPRDSRKLSRRRGETLRILLREIDRIKDLAAFGKFPKGKGGVRVRAQRHPSPASRTAAAMARQLSSLPTRDDTNEELLISSATGSEPPLRQSPGYPPGISDYPDG